MPRAGFIDHIGIGVPDLAVAKEYYDDLMSVLASANRFRPEVEIAGRQATVLTEQIRALDRSRLGRRVGTLAQAELRAVDDALKVVLGLF